MQFGKDNIFELLQNVYSKSNWNSTSTWKLDLIEIFLYAIPSDANRDLMDWSGKKPLDYRKPKTSVSASTYSSEYQDPMHAPFTSRTQSMLEKAHVRESSGFLNALTYPRRRGTTSSLGHYSAGSTAELGANVGRRQRKGDRRQTSTVVMVPASRESDEFSVSSTEKSDSGQTLSRRERNQQSFLRKKFGSINKKNRSSYI